MVRYALFVMVFPANNVFSVGLKMHGGGFVMCSLKTKTTIVSFTNCTRFNTAALSRAHTRTKTKSQLRRHQCRP